MHFQRMHLGVPETGCGQAESCSEGLSHQEFKSKLGQSDLRNRGVDSRNGEVDLRNFAGAF